MQEFWLITNNDSKLFAKQLKDAVNELAQRPDLRSELSIKYSTCAGTHATQPVIYSALISYETSE